MGFFNLLKPKKGAKKGKKKGPASKAGTKKKNKTSGKAATTSRAATSRKGAASARTLTTRSASSASRSASSKPKATPRADTLATKTTPKKTSSKGITKKTKKPPKRKNVSQRIPNGTTLQTRDDYLASGKDYQKPGYESKGNYRRVVVIDSNRNDELAVVKLTTKGRHPLKKYKKGKSTYNSYVEIMDNDDNPIKIGKKFIRNPIKENMSNQDVTEIKKNCFVNDSKSLIKENQKKVRRLKDGK